MSYRFETLQLHAGLVPDQETGARSVPIYQSNAFVFKDSNQAEARFALQEGGPIYSRLGNPTVEVLEQRIAALEGAKGAVASSSGMSAITYAFLNILRSGDEIVSSETLYGGTHCLMTDTFPKMGIKTKFAQSNAPAAFESAMSERTRAVYVESIGNPNADLVDIEAVAKVAHNHGVPLIVDNTFATPYLLRPIEYGADIVVHSATKYIGGHGTTMGGIVVDGGIFDWKNGLFPEFTQPDESYHGLVYADDGGDAPFAFKMRAQILRNTGACMSALDAFLLIQGVETLSIRMERHVSNTMKLLAYLEQEPKVLWIHYPTLASSPYKALAEKYYPRGCGGIFSMGIEGGQEKALAWLEHLKLFSNVSNVADAKSIVTHPGTTTHQQLSEDAKRAAGVPGECVRISVGLENADDLIEDMQQAFAAI